jgi:GNAT superfamily N-acetyltransferase
MEFRPLELSDRVTWARLLAVCFDRSPAQMESLLAWFHAGFPLVTMGAWDGETLVAQYNCRLLELRVSGVAHPVPAGMGLNMAVDPEYRKRGLLDQVATPVHERLAARGCVAGVGFSSAGGLAVTRASTHYAYDVLGPMVSLVVPVVRGRHPEPLVVRDAWPDIPVALSDGDDDLVRYEASEAGLRHRFAEHPFRRYRFATRERGGVVDGLVVFRETRLRGVPALSLLGVHGRDPRGLLGAFAATMRSVRRPVVHVLLTPCSPLRGALREIGPEIPLPFSRNPYHLIARALQPDAPRVLFDLQCWDCTGGDIL